LSRAEWREATASKSFFFEKKNQKTFVLYRLSVAAPRAPSRKKFLLLFSKKVLSSFVAAINNAGWYNLHVVDKVKFRGLVQASRPSFVQRRLAPLALA